jgi:signal transduction histidine kinase
VPQKVRTRLTVLYALLFLSGGIVLLGLTFALVSSSLSSLPNKVGTRPVLASCKSESGKRPSPALTLYCKKAFQAGATDAATAQRDRTLHNLHDYSILGLGLLTLASAGLGWLVSGRVLRPVRIITETARRASEQHLGERLALSGPRDELKELADTFDDMLDRLDSAFSGQRQFVANASHELRTPLTVMRTAIDVTLAKPSRSAEQLETMAAKVRHSIDRSEARIDALLTLASSNQGIETREFVDLATAAEDALDSAAPRIGDRGLAVTSDLQAAEVTGDRVLLERMIGNLVDNAVRHNTDGGWIHLRSGSRNGHVFVEVANSGLLVAQDQVPTLFEPFRRPAGRTGEGAGLGLSIVKSVATAHDGAVEAHGLAEGGLSVSVVLPHRTDRAD